MLFVDKHRPHSLSKLDYHDTLTSSLLNLSSKASEFPHLLVYGPSGAGKKTRIMALLRELYGPSVFKVKFEHLNFAASNASATKIAITTIASNHHIEINPSDVGATKDRFVIQHVIKQMASYASPLAKEKNVEGGASSSNIPIPFKVLVLMEVDRLSKSAQQALRRTMEKHTATCRLILCCNSPSKVIDPIKSRCVGIRIAAPSTQDILSVLQTVCEKESLNTNHELNLKIVAASNRNLRRALLMLESCYVQSYPFTKDQKVLLPEWEEYIMLLMKTILNEQSPAGLLKAREMVYNLLSNCIPAEVIINTLLRQSLCRMDDEIKPEAVHWAAYYEHRLHKGSKDVFHIEAFIAKFMQMYRKFLMELYG